MFLPDRPNPGSSLKFSDFYKRSGERPARLANGRELKTGGCKAMKKVLGFIVALISLILAGGAGFYWL